MIEILGVTNIEESKDKYVIFIGDEFTIKFKCLGYHYNAVDARKTDSMILEFNSYEEADKKANEIVELAKHYASKCLQSKRQGYMLQEVRYELEKITSERYNIVLPLIHDYLQNIWRYSSRVPSVLTYEFLRVAPFSDIEELRTRSK